jgi:hypothetical protein
MSGNNRSAGGFYSPTPVDFILLDKLPEVGMIGGVHWKGRRAKDLREEIIEGGVEATLVPMSFIGARLRSMGVAGLVQNYAGGTRGGIWARTPQGTEYLGKREEILGGAA